MTLTRTSGCLIFPSSETAASTDPTTSPFRTRFRSWIAPGLHLLEEPLDRDAARALRELLAPQALAARVRKLAGAPLVLDDASELAGRRRLVEAEDLHRVSRPGVLHLVAAEVVEGAHLAPGVSGDDRVADAERAAVDEHRRDGTAADVESRLDDRARGLGLRVCGQHELCIRHEQDLLEQVVEILSLLRRDVRELRRPTPLFGLEAFG